MDGSLERARGNGFCRMKGEPKENEPRTRVCVVCGKYLPKGRAAYCSDECQWDYYVRFDEEGRAWSVDWY